MSTDLTTNAIPHLSIRELDGMRPALAFANIEKALEIDKIRSIKNEAREFMCIRDQVLILPCDKEDLTPSGLVIIPESAREKQSEGLVIAVGPGRMDANNIWVRTSVQPGDRVLYYRYGGTEVKLRGKDCRLMTEDDIQGVIR